MTDLDPAQIMAEHAGTHGCVGWVSARDRHCLPYRLAAALVEAQEREQRVRALAEPYLGQPDGYQHYAITLTDGVHFAVLVDDLRVAIGDDR